MSPADEGDDHSRQWLAVVLLDSGLKQVEVFVRDLTMTAEVNTGIAEIDVRVNVHVAVV